MPAIARVHTRVRERFRPINAIRALPTTARSAYVVTRAIDDTRQAFRTCNSVARRKNRFARACESACGSHRHLRGHRLTPAPRFANAWRREARPCHALAPLCSSAAGAYAPEGVDGVRFPRV